MRTLVVIMDENEPQARDFCALAVDLGIPTIKLTSETYNHLWSFKASSDESDSFFIEVSDQIINLADDRFCFYWRAPWYANNEAATMPMGILFDALAYEATPNGSYLSSIEAQYWDGSKLHNLALHCGYDTPYSKMTNSIPADINPETFIVKANSSLRTEVVRLSDERLKMGEHDRQDTPLLLQQLVEGEDIKVNCYRKRDGTWLIFANRVEKGSKVDFRFADNFVLHEETRFTFEDVANKIYQQSGARYFDCDFRVDASENLTFLEANFSPAPITAEDMIPNFNRRFSTQLLLDWVGA